MLPQVGLPLIAVRDLVKRFGEVTVLDGLTLDIPRGETIVVIGGSGSGKSTLARLLMGLELPTSGRILLEGVDLAGLHRKALEAARARFAMVFQGAALLDSMSVYENVAFPLREEKQLEEPVVHDRVLEALGELGVAEAVGKLPGQLSGGMAKRVSIARAIVTEPEILVYDEPTTGLDPPASRSVDAIIEGMRDKHLVTSLVITHDMMTAYDVADRILLLEGGKIVADGDPETIFRSHDGLIRPFAAASGLDLDTLGPRRPRKSAAEIRAQWDATRSAAPPAHRGWLYQWMHHQATPSRR